MRTYIPRRINDTLGIVSGDPPPRHRSFYQPPSDTNRVAMLIKICTLIGSSYCNSQGNDPRTVGMSTPIPWKTMYPKAAKTNENLMPAHQAAMRAKPFDAP